MKKGIVIHCSDSTFGSSIEIDRWHRERGWSNVGYHFVICNGQVENNTYLDCMDGAIERGRDKDASGAHAKGYNSYIGICLVGIDQFTDKQYKALETLIKELQAKYGIKSRDIIGHYEVSSKTCPNMDVRRFVEWRIDD
jgi:N-acetylmuramoyl-L-alanine amidase